MNNLLYNKWKAIWKLEIKEGRTNAISQCKGNSCLKNESDWKNQIMVVNTQKTKEFSQEKIEEKGGLPPLLLLLVKNVLTFLNI